MPSSTPENDIPPALAGLADQIQKLGWEAAKRLVVSKVGSIKSGERFSDDVADAVFLRLQQNSQVGRYAEEADIFRLGRDAHRLTGEGSITLYRAAPKGSGIRPGDFATDTAAEAGFYRHGGNVIHTVTIPKTAVIAVEGSSGGGQEFIYLPHDYTPPQPIEWFADFRSFFEATRPSPEAKHGNTGEHDPAADEDDAAPAFRMR